MAFPLRQTWLIFSEPRLPERVLFYTAREKFCAGISHQARVNICTVGIIGMAEA